MNIPGQSFAQKAATLVFDVKLSIGCDLEIFRIKSFVDDLKDVVAKQMGCDFPDYFVFGLK